ncbi:MAG: hypothetical protein JNM00_11335 [Flavobacteriales bacterium]|nr:hypothetical protein [Flavobacteriales bacterium]
MKTIKYLVAIIMLLLPLLGEAQPPQKDIPLTVRAIKSYQTNLDASIALSDSACMHAPEKNHPYAWYTRAFLYKEKFKQTDSSNTQSAWRETSLSSLRKSMELDRSGEYKDQMRTLLDYLSKSYYTQLTQCLDYFTPEQEQECHMLWLKYQETQEMLQNQGKLAKEARDFYFTLADKHMELYQRNAVAYEKHLHKAYDCYANMLKLDSADYKANYNIAIYYYNQGVNIISGFNENTSLEEMITLQEKCIALFRQSLPYMQKAQELRPDRQETLKGLYIIYRALSEEDKSFFYKTELEKLIKSGGTNPLKWENKDE